MQEFHEQSYFRKGTALFELGEYESAKRAFETGKRLRGERGQEVSIYSRAIRKCESEISPELQPTIATPALPAAIPASIKYQYYQSQDYLNISILAKNVNPNDAKIEIQANRIRVVIPVESREETVIDKFLYGQVDVAACKTDFRSTKIEIVLRKGTPGIWPSIDGPSAPVAVPVVNSAVLPSVSSALPVDVPCKKVKPYASNRDWDTIEKQINDELEAEKPEGEAALQKLFRDIYSKADEDTRKAMNKSFQTSGGTVLSTNWKEVAEKNYEKERQAPKGMEWRSYEGDKLDQLPDDKNGVE